MASDEPRSDEEQQRMDELPAHETRGRRDETTDFMVGDEEEPAIDPDEPPPAYRPPTS